MRSVKVNNHYCVNDLLLYITLNVCRHFKQTKIIQFFFFYILFIVYSESKVDSDTELDTHVGIAHTRWATHGPPSETNSHPQRSDINSTFVVVHNGIITNYKDVKGFLESKGHVFESETDTEVIAKLIFHLYKEHPNYSFRELVEQVVQQLVNDITKQMLFAYSLKVYLHYIPFFCRKEHLHWHLNPNFFLMNALQRDVVHHYWLE